MLTSPELVWLLAAVAKGDEAAFERLYQATRAKLYGGVLRILRRADLAGAVMQETYLEVWNSAGRFDPASDSPITWMLAIARNRAIDRVRGKSATSMDEEPEAIQAAADTPDPLAEREMSEALKRLLSCMGRLDPERRRLVLLAYYGGSSREELATAVDRPVNTIKTWLRRALFDIREGLGAMNRGASQTPPGPVPDDRSLMLSEDMLAAEYVLGTLDPAEREDAQARKASDFSFAALVHHWERRLGELHALTGDAEPPPAVWDAIRAKLADMAPSAALWLPEVEPPAPAPMAGAVVELRARLTRWRALSAVAAALAAALVLFVVTSALAPGLMPGRLRLKPEVAAPAPGAGTASAPRFVAVLQREATAPAFILTVDVANRTLTIRRVSAPREPGRAYQLWLISNKLPEPRSLGLVGADDFTQASDPILFDTATIGDATFAVSLEPDGGSPTGAPSNVMFLGKSIEATPPAIGQPAVQ
jgi:RNA polymerase sigma-70 factor (ECF subfamily)